MPSMRVHLPPYAAVDWDRLRADLAVPGAFPPEVLAEAEAAARDVRLPDLDLTALPFFTVDPPDSLDLDQAMCLARSGAGFRVEYAIADVAAFVVPGGAVDVEAHVRGETSYFPDLRVPLHPPVIAEGAGSLLAEQVRPAVVWGLDLGAEGEVTAVEVRRAQVRSRRKLSYEGVQASLDDGTADEQLQLLREIGTLRQALARARDAVDLPTPEQEVSDGPDGRPCLAFRAQLPVEAWNAQISLMTGIAAAGIMLEGSVGLLRTLPPADPQAVASLRRSALALGVRWEEGEPWGDVVSRLDAHDPGSAALLTLTTRLLRGAAYTAFDGTPPEQPLHSAVAAAYAHCTAPLRRLADRYVNEVCLALRAGTPVPDWARSALPALPEEMAASSKRSAAIERAIVDLAEAVVLAPRVGEEFDAVVVDKQAVQLVDPAVRAKCEGDDLPLGQRIRVVLTQADPTTRTVLFRPV